MPLVRLDGGDPASLRRHEQRLQRYFGMGAVGRRNWRNDIARELEYDAWFQAWRGFQVVGYMTRDMLPPEFEQFGFEDQRRTVARRALENQRFEDAMGRYREALTEYERARALWLPQHFGAMSKKQQNAAAANAAEAARKRSLSGSTSDLRVDDFPTWSRPPVAPRPPSRPRVAFTEQELLLHRFAAYVTSSGVNPPVRHAVVGGHRCKVESRTDHFFVVCNAAEPSGIERMIFIASDPPAVGKKVPLVAAGDQPQESDRLHRQYTSLMDYFDAWHVVIYPEYLRNYPNGVPQPRKLYVLFVGTNLLKLQFLDAVLIEHDNLLDV